MTFSTIKREIDVIQYSRDLTKGVIKNLWYITQIKKTEKHHVLTKFVGHGQAIYIEDINAVIGKINDKIINITLTQMNCQQKVNIP